MRKSHDKAGGMLIPDSTRSKPHAITFSVSHRWVLKGEKLKQGWDD